MSFMIFICLIFLLIRHKYHHFPARITIQSAGSNYECFALHLSASAKSRLCHRFSSSPTKLNMATSLQLSFAFIFAVPELTKTVRFILSQYPVHLLAILISIRFEQCAYDQFQDDIIAMMKLMKDDGFYSVFDDISKSEYIAVYMVEIYEAAKI